MSTASESALSIRCLSSRSSESSRPTRRMPGRLPDTLLTTGWIYGSIPPMKAILCSRQYNLYMKNEVALQNTLVFLTDKVFPDMNELFSDPDRTDDSQKRVDIVMTFWYCECINLVSKVAFTERYCKWCERKRFHFSKKNAKQSYFKATRF